MQHLDEGFLHALADGEVPSDELGPVREHLESCETCRTRLDEARMEAETARELVELIEVPVLAPADRRFGGSADRPVDGRTGRRAGGLWVRGLALAASLVLAAGIGYYGRGGYAPFAQKIEPTSLGRIDTVFLDVPAEVGQTQENDANRNAGLGRVSRSVEPQAAPPAQAAATARADEKTELAGARRENDKDKKRTLGDSASFRLDEVVVTGVAEAPKASTPAKKEVESKLNEPLRQRAANDSRDQSPVPLGRKAAPQPAAPSVALAEERLMAKTAADAAAVVVTFPRAVELLGGRIKLIEGMVPVRLEAVGRMVRVIYVIDEGDLVLAQVSGPDSLNWNLSGPVGADSLARLRLRVR